MVFMCSSRIRSHMSRLLPGAALTLLAVSACPGQTGATAATRQGAGAPYAGATAVDGGSGRESRPAVEKGFRVGGGFVGSSSSLTMTNNSINNMLALAYGVSSHKMQGVPDWAANAMYNVQAKADD